MLCAKGQTSVMVQAQNSLTNAGLISSTYCSTFCYLFCCWSWTEVVDNCCWRSGV